MESKVKYDQVPGRASDIEDEILNFESYDDSSRQRPKRHNLTICFLAVNAIVLSLCVAFAGFMFGRRFPQNAACATRFSTWSPALAKTRFVETKMEGAFFHKSKYRGPPSKAIDEAWDDLWMIGGVPLRINDDDFWRTRKDPKKNWSRIPEDLGGGVRGYPHVFHQLHCLNMLRKTTHMEYYKDVTVFQASSEVVRAHLDHCIDILRQQLMCSAEMAPTFTYTVDGVDEPLPDFSSILQCKNFDELKTWTQQNVIHDGGDWDIPDGHTHLS